MKSITPRGLHDLLAAGLPVALLDVREPQEREVSHIGGLHVPMGDVPLRLQELKEELDAQSQIVVYCRSGKRSAAVVSLLESAGLTNVYNLEGGMKAWRDAIDPTLPVA